MLLCRLERETCQWGLRGPSLCRGAVILCAWTRGVSARRSGHLPGLSTDARGCGARGTEQGDWACWLCWIRLDVHLGVSLRTVCA
jgi:hypothetical protein